MVAITLTDRQQAAFRAVVSAEPVLGAPLPTKDLLEKIALLVPCDAIAATLADNRGYVVEEVDVPPWWDYRCLDHSHAERPLYVGIMHWSAHPLEAQVCGVNLERGDSLAIGFRNGPDHVAQLAFDRVKGNFTDRDVAMLDLLSPVLRRLLRERLTPELPASLTVAERRVLMHVEAGFSNAEIARVLFIAPSTVRKHLEHSFRKLGVNSRLAAVARLQRRDASEIQLHDRIVRDE